MDDRKQTPAPFVIAAAFCESLLQEGPEEGGLISAIRILESIQAYSELLLEPHDDPKQIEQPPIPVELKLLVMLRGIPNGKHILQLTAIRPDGTRSEQPLRQEFFGGGVASGANLKIDVRIAFAVGGLFWFEIACDDHVLTRVPLDVEVERRFRVRNQTENGDSFEMPGGQQNESPA